MAAATDWANTVLPALDKKWLFQPDNLSWTLRQINWRCLPLDLETKRGRPRYLDGACNVRICETPIKITNKQLSIRTSTHPLRQIPPKVPPLTCHGWPIHGRKTPRLKWRIRINNTTDNIFFSTSHGSISSPSFQATHRPPARPRANREIPQRGVTTGQPVKRRKIRRKAQLESATSTQTALQSEKTRKQSTKTTSKTRSPNLGDSF